MGLVDGVIGSVGSRGVESEFTVFSALVHDIIDQSVYQSYRNEKSPIILNSERGKKH